MIVFTSYLLLTCFLSYIAERYKNNQFAFFYFALLTALILSFLSGFRTEYNDTLRYIFNFHFGIPTQFSDLNLSEFKLGDNPGFYFYQFLIKNFISGNPQVFILISAVITNVLIVFFYKKYSVGFGFSIYLFIASGLYLLGFAAIKQMLAIAIGLWGVNYFYKDQHIKFIFVLLIASTIHPFVLLFLSAYLLNDDVWTRKMVLSFVIVILIGFVFTQFVESILSVVEGVGVKYESSYILEKQGMNLFRVVFYSIVPILSFIYRKKISSNKNKMLILATNFSIVSFLIMIIASYGGANMFGRMASYFEPFIYVAFPWISYIAIPKFIRHYFVATICALYCFFFYYQMVVVKDFTYHHIFN